MLGPKVHFDGGVEPWGIALGDLDGDGDLDLVTTHGGDGPFVGVLLGRGDGTFTARVDYRVGFEARGVTLGDIS